MKFFTSYFAKIPKLQIHNIIPISIAGYTPVWYSGLEYKTLAPKWSFFYKWKYENKNNDYYIEHFQIEVLDMLDIKKVIKDLENIAKLKDIALICYEKPSDFCHRHLVADWFLKHGYNIKEFDERKD